MTKTCKRRSKPFSCTLLAFTTPNVFLLPPFQSSDAYSTIAPIYSLLFHVYYRLVMDSAGQADFSKAVPAFGGLGKTYWEAVFSKGVLNVITFVDWCCLLGVKNQGILNELIDHVESQRAVFHDEVIGFFMEVNGKLEDMATRLMDESESKANRSEFVLFVRDIVNCCSTFIQCVPKVGSFERIDL